MKNKYVSLCALMLYSSSLFSVDWGSLNPFSSKDKYLTTFRTLREMESTLAEIETTNRAIINAEKDIAAASAKQKRDLEKSIADAETSLKKLSEDAINDAKIKIKAIQDSIDRHEGDINKNKELLAKEDWLLKSAQTANKFALGWLGFATNYLRNADESSKKDLEKSIEKSRSEIINYQKALEKEQEAFRNIFTSKSYQSKAAEITKSIQEATAALSNVIVSANELRKAKIFNPYNEKADQLLAKLKQQIKTANCDMIKTIADAKQRNIDTCKQKALDNIKKSFSAPACKALTLTSSIEEINQCAASSKSSKKSDKLPAAPGGPKG